MKRHLSLLSFAFLLFTGAPSVTQAALIASDDFIFGAAAPAYTSGSSPANRSGTGTVGFTGAWFNNNTGYFNTNNTNLSISGYASTGGSMLVTPNSNGNFSRSISRTFTPIPASPAVTTIWTSTLFRPSTLAFDPGRQSMLQFLSGGAGSASPTSILSSASDPSSSLWGGADGLSSGNQLQGFGFGISTFAATSSTLSIKYQSGNNQVALANTNVALNLDTTYLVISKLNLNVSGTYDTLDFWLVTSLPANEAALGAPSFSLGVGSQANILDSASLLTNTVFSGGVSVDSPSTSSITNYDALRIGTSFADVTAVPEPTRIVLFGLALSVTALRRRRC